MLDCGKKPNTPCAGGGSNDDTSDTLLDCCVFCNIALWVSDSVLLGDTLTAKYYEVVYHMFLLIEECIWCRRFTCFLKKFLDWENI
jgi:hypothetical protein